MESYLEENSNIFIDFADEACKDYLKLKVCMYANDTIIMSLGAQGLQNALNVNSLHKYCHKCGLSVNRSKTKITILETEKNSNIFNFKLNDNV